MQKDDFIKHGDRTRGWKELRWVVKSDWLYTMELGQIKSRGSVLKGLPHANEDPQITGGLAIAKLRWVFPPAKYQLEDSRVFLEIRLLIR